MVCPLPAPASIPASAQRRLWQATLSPAAGMSAHASLAYIGLRLA
jgi:hypothetical protein